jgi:hypothetical protein
MLCGVIIVSLMHQFKKMKLSIKNESVVDTTGNIVISIQNDLNNDITIKAGDASCYSKCINI